MKYHQSPITRPIIIGHAGPVLRTFRKLKSCCKGAIAIEFAMLMPMILLLFLGGFETSTVIRQKLAIQNAARIGAQYGLVRRPVQGDMQNVVDAVRRTMPVEWNDTNLATAAQVNATLECECTTSGTIACGSSCAGGQRKLTFLKVKINKTYQTYFTYPGIGNNFQISDESLVRLR